MPKKPVEPPRGEVIIQANMERVMRDSMLPYAEHVILDRALPRVEDGLKPVQRRILYTMSELSLLPDKPHRKCARIVGDCLGKYHPHGDSSVYDALARMAQPFSMRGLFVDGHGNFGSIDGDSPAAMRYTEARMAPLALEMLRDIDKDTVPFALNFDDTLREPELMPAHFPNLLVNGASGIAVGLATNIPPHNLGETIDACIALIENPDLTTRELMQYVPCPDFPTGGVLLDTPEIEQAYATGRGKLTLRAKVHIEDGNAGRKLIVITEVPYQIAKSAMLEKILKISEEKKGILSGIHDIRDESDRTGLRAVIEVKRDVDPQKVLAVLYKYSDLQVTYGVNLMAIADGKPQLLGLKQALTYYLKHQENVFTRRTRYELDQAKARLHILDGLIIAVDNLDEIIRIIRAAKNDKEAKANLIAAFSFTDIQAQAILDLRLRRLTGLEIETLRAEHAQTIKLVNRLESILASRRKLLGVIREELLQTRKQYADARRTLLLKEDVQEADLPEAAEMPEPEEAVVLLTEEGRLRRMHPKWFEKLGEPEEEKDRIRFFFSTLSDATLYFLTDLGNCYTLPVDSLPESNRAKEKGTLLTGLLSGLEKGEKCIQLFCVRNGEMQNMPDWIFFTQKGLIKRTPAAQYVVRKSKFAALTLKGDDRLLSVLPLTETEILLISRSGMAIRFTADQVPVNGRTAAGVKAMSLDEGDALAFAFITAPDEGEVLLVTDRGYAKKSLLLDFDLQKRSGKGVKSITLQKNGANGTCIAGALYVRQPITFRIHQRISVPTAFSSEDVQIELRSGKGAPFVAALMDDVVTHIDVQIENA